MRNLDFELEPGGGNKLAPLRITILYENLECGKQARRTYDYLVDSLAGDCELTAQLWKFSLLDDPRLQILALEDAAESDVVIVASEGSIELPPGVCAWFELWLQEKQRPMALVALFSEPANTAPVRKYLQKLARQNGIDFFTQPGSASKPLLLGPFTADQFHVPLLQP